MRDFKSDSNFSNFIGTRFEAGIADSLIDKEIEFMWSDRPDFEIDGGDFQIECTSRHLRKTEDIELEKVIKGKIGDKQGKNYENKETILMVEITNLFWQMAATPATLQNKDDLKSSVESKLEKTDYGSLILFTLIFKQGSIGSAYIRVDNSNIGNGLKSFLDENYPIGNKHFNKPFFPMSI